VGTKQNKAFYLFIGFPFSSVCLCDLWVCDNQHVNTVFMVSCILGE
jgi:hypothetical protein